MVWAWERPEDLRFVNPKTVGVAFLAATVEIQDGRVRVRPRLNPLLVPDGTKLMAVVRVESSGKLPERADPVAAELVRATQMSGVTGLQLDYDAKASERGFYRELVRAARAALPKDYPFSITALVSWCVGDPWIRNLPVTDAVPMYFRMGPERDLRRDPSTVSLCQSSIGLSTDELFRVSLPQRVFLFHPRPWTREALRTAISEVNRWR